MPATCASVAASSGIGASAIACRKSRSGELCAARASIGMVFQRFNLFQNMTVLENVTLAPRLARKLGAADAERKALALLERVGLAGKKHRYPNRLSGGEQQRVAIARVAGDGAIGHAVRRGHIGARPGARGRGARRHARAGRATA